MKTKKLAVYLSVTLLVGCALNETRQDEVKEADRKEEFKTRCEVSHEMELSIDPSIGFVGFDYDEIKIIKVVEMTADHNVVNERRVDLEDTDYEYFAGQAGNEGYSVVMPNVVRSANNIYDFILSDGATYRLHNIATTAFTDYAEPEYWSCEVTEYDINDGRFSDYNSITIHKR